MLAVKKLPNSNGYVIGAATHETLVDWNADSNVCGRCFDTTSSNTGHLTAAVITLQIKLGRPILWLACRHHVAEVILTHVFTELGIETAHSPNIALFHRYRDIWPHLQKTTDSCNFYDCPIGLTEIKDRVLPFLKTLQNSYQVRGDYKELLDLSVLFIEGKPDTTINLKTCGAIHKARWMAKIIYSIKMVLQKNQLLNLAKGSVFIDKQFDKLYEFVLFCVYIYVPYWFKASFAIQAPLNDLELFQILYEFNSVNSIISVSALNALKNHGWYLCEELVCICLFDDRLSIRVKESIVMKIIPYLNLETNLELNRHGEGFGKPVMPTITRDTTLSQLVGEGSIFIFKALNINTDFLFKSASTWNTLDLYNRDKNKLVNLKCVNDLAERGIKLSCDFKNSARQEDNFQNILQAVECNRKSVKNIRSRKGEMKWILHANEH